MLEHIDPDQLLECYGGTLKRPDTLFPPKMTLQPYTQPKNPEGADEQNYYFKDINNYKTNQEQEISFSEQIFQDSMDEGINVKQQNRKYTPLTAFGSKAPEKPMNVTASVHPNDEMEIVQKSTNLKTTQVIGPQKEKKAGANMNSGKEHALAVREYAPRSVGSELQEDNNQMKMIPVVNSPEKNQNEGENDGYKGKIKDPELRNQIMRIDEEKKEACCVGCCLI